MRAVTAAAIGGMNIGVVIPTPFTGRATKCVINATANTPMRQRKIIEGADLMSK